MWLRRRTLGAFARQKPVFYSLTLLLSLLLCAVIVFVMLAALGEEHFDLYVSIGMWAIFFGSAGIFTLSVARLTLNSNHLLSFPISTPLAYVLLLLDRLTTCGGAAIVFTLPTAYFLVTTYKFWVIVFLYAIVLSALRVLLESAQTLRLRAENFNPNTLLYDLLLFLLLAGHLFAAAAHNLYLLSNDQEYASTALYFALERSYSALAPVFQYLLPGAVAELGRQSLVRGNSISLLWVAIAALQGTLIITLSYITFRAAAAEYRQLAPQPQLNADTIRKAEREASSREETTALSLLWVRFISDPRMREIVVVQGIGYSAYSRIWRSYIVFLVILVLLRLGLDSFSINDKTLGFNFGMIVMALVAVFSGITCMPVKLKAHLLQTPIQRNRLLLAFSLYTISLFATIVVPICLILSPMPILTTLFYIPILLAILMASLPNGYVAILLSAYSDYSIEVSLGKRHALRSPSSAVLGFSYLLFLIPLYPLYAPLLRFVVEGKPLATLPCSPLYLLGCVIYAILYFYFGSKFAAWLLTKRELWYIEKALYRRG